MRTLLLVPTILLVGCTHNTHSSTPPAPGQAPIASVAPAPAPIQFEPIAVDLRPRLTQLGLTPRPQGHRGTCSIFTTCSAIEYAMAMRDGSTQRQSPEFLNWAGAQMVGGVSDGNFFHNALNGYEKFGLCSETAMPYSKTYDSNNAPSEQAMKEAAATRAASKDTIKINWIIPWNAGKRGVNDTELAEIKRVLRSGNPIAAGSGHSRLLVGYKDDATKPGGGTFITEDSALNRFDEVTYEFVRKDVCDVFWVEYVAPSN